MSRPTLLLVIENELKDIRIAEEAAKSVGFDEVQAKVTIPAARQFLENGLEQEDALPDGILLDLDLGYDSGYELLRYWHATPRLRSIPVLVWSILGEENAEICKLFKVSSFVGKWEGPAAIQEALAGLRQ
jgi:CheY-like chemotaxis protein